ncbi:xanthine dehydrogenase family protein molybdopterin-binding subunit [Xanthocytophaga flavus]|uniref:xanthine dehydrogenase family protein molybdopterin-binding subunit n=1 Tax=Xanthocytophaga flava TaxID=3048013 RepID=UPI0028D4D9A8|nr:molybdopterin cofactor-binding domain-containing protein [Xanthocytophaga flavus]
MKGFDVVTGKPLCTFDYGQKELRITMIVYPSAFRMRAKPVEDNPVTTLLDNCKQNGLTQPALLSWLLLHGQHLQVLSSKKVLNVQWEKTPEATVVVAGFGDKQSVKIPAGLESTPDHLAKLAQLAKKPGKVLRKDGDTNAAFVKAAKVIERTYTAPFLAHNAMEPVNCFAHVTKDKAEIVAPIQAPEFIMQALTARLGLSKEQIHIKLARMGGGFGQRAYGHHLVEAAVISQKLAAPVKLVYTREDDMTYGIYRPMYTATYKAGLDAQGSLIAYQVKAGGIPEGPLGWSHNRFPAGAVDNYLAEEWSQNSNITIGAFRAPRSNFLGGAEQSFLDEVAELAGKDPIQFRLDLLERAKTKPVGKDNDYDPDRYAGVLKLVRDKSNWKKTDGQPKGKDTSPGAVNRGVSAYFCHNTYVAQVVDLSMKENQPVVHKVYAAVDCGVVVNPDAAVNMGEGGIIDGIGNALFGEMTFQDGVPQKSNFDKYRMIRHGEAPKSIEIHFIKSDADPTGLGEPLFPPIFAALANAIYQATGKRQYSQPFLQGNQPLA